MSDAPENLLSLGGNPGEPVPEVDPEDLKSVWQMAPDPPHFYDCVKLTISQLAVKGKALVLASLVRGDPSSLVPVFLLRYFVLFAVTFWLKRS